MAVYWLSSEWIIKIKIKNNELVTQPNKQENQVAIFVTINQHVYFFFFFLQSQKQRYKIKIWNFEKDQVYFKKYLQVKIWGE